MEQDSGTPVTVPLESGGTDLLTGRPASGEITLPPLGAAVVRRARQA
ncbi:Beta-galactosidase C-terminal domain [Microbispora sp. NPDC049633]